MIPATTIASWRVLVGGVLPAPPAPRRSNSVWTLFALRVSQSAVSRAFTPDAAIAESTRLKILEAAKKLGYRARSAFKLKKRTQEDFLIKRFSGDFRFSVTKLIADGA